MVYAVVVGIFYPKVSSKLSRVVFWTGPIVFRIIINLHLHNILCQLTSWHDPHVFVGDVNVRSLLT